MGRGVYWIDSLIHFVSADKSRHPWVNTKVCHDVLAIFFQVMLKSFAVIEAGNYRHSLTNTLNKPLVLMRNCKLNCNSWTWEELKQSRKTKMCFLPAEYPSSVRATPLWDTGWFISHTARHTYSTDNSEHFRTFGVLMMRWCCLHTGPGLERRS